MGRLACPRPRRAAARAGCRGLWNRPLHGNGNPGHKAASFARGIARTGCEAFASGDAGPAFKSCPGPTDSGRPRGEDSRGAYRERRRDLCGRMTVTGRNDLNPPMQPFRASLSAALLSAALLASAFSVVAQDITPFDPLADAREFDPGRLREWSKNSIRILETYKDYK